MVALTHILCTFLLTAQQALSTSPPKKVEPVPQYQGINALSPFLVSHKQGARLVKSVEEGYALQIDTFFLSGGGKGTISLVNANNIRDVALHIAFDGPDSRVRINSRIAGKWGPNQLLDFYQSNVTFPASPTCPNKRKVCLEVRFVPEPDRGPGEGCYRIKFYNGNTIMAAGKKLKPYLGKVKKSSELVKKGINAKYVWLENWFSHNGGFSELTVTPLYSPSESRDKDD
ncbi:hypothetical protein TWF696_000982 [Orbilia brochopaga]|uniref:Galectin n=1 Tax=Orbilia brochopaga TaxID=3140254 RepID=A0AAV9VFN1_9PEZI